MGEPYGGLAGGRKIHSLVYRLADAGKAFTMSARVRRPADLASDEGAGFRLGIRADIDDARAACFEKGGLRGDALVLGDREAALGGELPADGLVATSRCAVSTKATTGGRPGWGRGTRFGIGECRARRLCGTRTGLS